KSGVLLLDEVPPALVFSRRSRSATGSDAMSSTPTHTPIRSVDDRSAERVITGSIATTTTATTRIAVPRRNVRVRARMKNSRRAIAQMVGIDLIVVPPAT